jgi:hypothetical protein
MACPGSVQLSKGRPNKGSVFADEGTAAHELASRCLERELDPIVFLDTIIQTDDMETAVSVTEEMVEAVTVYVNYVRGRVEEGYELVGIEQQFDLAPLNPPAPMYGRADGVLFKEAELPQKRPGMVYLPKPSVLEVPDFKYGAGTVVEAEGNSQGLYYAIGAVLATERKADRIRVTIVQPRASHPDGIIRSWEITWDELVAFRAELLAAAVATQAEDAPLAAGSHCRFCPALAVCPAQADQAQAAARNTFEVMAVQSELNVPVPEALSISELQQVMAVAGPIQDWLKSVQAHMRDLTEAGEDTGYKLVPKRGRRKWKNEAAAEQVLRDRGGHDAAFTSKLRSVTQAEKYLKEHGAGDVPEELWAMISSGTNIVPNDDPRPAVPALPAPEEVFTAQEIAGIPKPAEGAEETTVIPAEDIAVERYPEYEPTYEIEDEYEPNVAAAQLWKIEVPGQDEFYVEAQDEASAKAEARKEMGVDRLPNHTTVSLS